MELRRIVDRLLEERRYLTPRQGEQAVPNKVKLPPFWEKDAAAWFKLAEAVLEDNRLRDPRVMYIVQNCDTPHPPPRAGDGQGVLSLAGTGADPFKELKDRLVELLTPQRAGPVHQHLVGSRAWRPKVHRAGGGHAGLSADG